MAANPAETEHRPTSSATNDEARVNQDHELEIVVKAEVLEVERRVGLTRWCLTVKASRFLLTVTQYFQKSDTRPAWAEEGEAEFANWSRISLP